MNTDRKSLLALRDLAPESEAESVRFRGRRVTKSGPGSQTRSQEGWRMPESIWPFQSGSPRDISKDGLK
jgi:hypothetical protein